MMPALRDVLTRYSNCQFLVILLGVSTEGISIAVDRIFDEYYKLKTDIVFKPSYIVADPDKGASRSVRSAPT